MKAKLFAKTGQFAGSSFEIDGTVSIGKSPGNEIQLLASTISGTHARIRYDDRRKLFLIEDLKSRNGTWVDGVRVREPVRLDNLNIISLAKSFDMIFQIVELETGGEATLPPREKKPVDMPASKPDPEESRPQPRKEEKKTILDEGPGARPPIPGTSGQTDPEPSKTQFDDTPITPPALKSPAADKKGALTPPETPSPKPPELVLEVNLKDGVRSFPLKEGRNLIGREGSCDVVLVDPSISRRHATIVLSGEVVEIRDLNSKNGTTVDGKSARSPIKLTTGQEIVIGSVKTRVKRR